MNFHPDVLAAHAEFGGDLESMQKLYEYAELKEANARMRGLLGKVRGVCMGVAMSGRAEGVTDGALMELFNEFQAILFPPAANVATGTTLAGRDALEKERG